MRSLLRALLPPLLLVAACVDDPDSDPAALPAPAAAAAVATAADFVAGEVIVKLHTPIDGTSPVEVAGQRLVPIVKLPSGAWLMRLDDHLRRGRAVADLEADTLDALDALRVDPDVVFAHENVRFEWSLTPNDGLYPLQWHWAPTFVPQAWDRTTGSAAVRIALIDTGRREHPDLAGRWDPGFDFVDNDADPTDPGTWAHGIHVAGIAGAASNNGTGGAGLCWNCRLIPLRVTPTIAQAEQAIAWAAGADGFPRRADIINMSFNTSTGDCNAFPGLRDAIIRAGNRGLSVTTSAGNQARTTGPTVPATCPGAIAVAASGPDAVIAPYSNRGPGTDLVAPGGGGNGQTQYGAGIGCVADPNPNDPYNGTIGVLSTWSIGASHCYRYLSGTSMSAPYVAGVIGLMRSARPNITPAEIETILANTALPNAVACGPVGACGAGLVNADAAVAAAIGVVAPELSVSPTSIQFGTQQTFTTSAPRTFTLSNTGGGALTFSVTSSGTFPINCNGSCSGSLPAGTSRTMTVAFAPDSQGSYGGSVTITSNDADESPFYLPLSGTGIGPLIDTPPLSLAFGNVLVTGGSASHVVTILNSSIATMPLTWAVSSTSGEFAVQCGGPCSGTLQPGQSWPVTIVFDPATTGLRTGTIIYTSNDLGRPTLTTQVSGTGVTPVLTVTPTAIDFGNVRRGTSSAPQLVTVGNAGNAVLAFTAASTGADFGLGCNGSCSVALAPGQTRTLSVVFTPLAAGLRSGTIAISSNDPARPGASVALSGTGVAPIMTVSPNGLAFGNVVVGTTSPWQVIVIGNTGTASLTFAATLPAGEFTMTCPFGCGGTLQPGQSWALNVRFAPTSAGSKSATVAITSDDVVRPSAQVLLSGVGVAPEISVWPRRLDFGTAPLGSPTTSSAWIQNSGSAPLTVSTAVVPPGFTVAAGLPQVIAPGASYNLQVTCTRVTYGTFTGDLMIGHNAGLPVSVPMTCTSTGATLELVAPASAQLLLWPWDVGTVIVRNTGPQPLTMTDIVFGDGPFTWFSHDGLPLPTTLAAGAQASFMVTCSPQWRSGTHWEKVSVTHDGLDTGSLLEVGCNAGPYEIIIDPPGFPPPFPPPQTH